MTNLVYGFILLLLLLSVIGLLFRLKTTKDELKAVYNSVNSLVIQLNRRGDYLRINSSDDSLLAKSREELIGKNLKDTFDEEKARFFQEALDKCFSEKKLVEIEYPLLTHLNEERWFKARISYKNDNVAIFNAIDVTDKVVREKALLQSKQQLKRTNEIKDKFFSIIAHDLKGPMGTFLSMCQLLDRNYKEMDNSSREDFIHSLWQSAERTNKLLEKLLEWSRAHSDKIEVELKDYDIKELGSSVIEDFQKTAQLKSITLKNEIAENISVRIDKNLVETILRNLVSNAIKYTANFGEVRIKSVVSSVNGDKNLVKLVVTDSGIGMNKEKVETLLHLDSSSSTPGTGGERGTGLGLILCDEFARKLGTSLTIESEPGKGTSFSFKVPKGI